MSIEGKQLPNSAFSQICYGIKEGYDGQEIKGWVMGWGMGWVIQQSSIARQKCELKTAST